jgi:hypothetical protein
MGVGVDMDMGCNTIPTPTALATLGYMSCQPMPVACAEGPGGLSLWGSGRGH